MALSDSDTTTSPTLGSSSASEKFRDIQNAESFNLSFDGKSDRSGFSDNSHKNLEVNVASGDDIDNTSADKETVIIHDDSDGSFKRNSENRNSDVSNNSSISQGIQADKDFGKHGSDISDMSMSEGRLTPKNSRDLENYLQTTDESGIVSETTSSNHSEGSQQSDLINYRFDPSEIAQKIMFDVSVHKTALDSMQKLSMIQSQTDAHNLRTEYQNQTTPVSLPSADNKLLHKLSENTAAVSDASSVQSNIPSFAANNAGQSAFASPTHKNRLPPPVAAKPTFQSNVSEFRNLSTNISNLTAIPTSESTTSTAAQLSNVPLTPISTAVLANPASSSGFTTTAIMVSKHESFSSSTSTTMPFTSFRPAGRPTPAESVSNVLQHRPDSTNSTSSHCSTPSSMQSVIYRPYADKRTPDSPCVVAYDSSSEQTSGSGSTTTPTVSMSENYPNNVIQSPKRDSSPALSSCSSTSGKSGKQKKKVSFSDSEPSDTPSPLDSSASSYQLSYFDRKKPSFGSIPPRLGNTHSALQIQTSFQNSSNSSLDSAGKMAGNSQRPPPPSYQYAIRNSQLLHNKSPERRAGTLLQQTSRQSYSSSSSPNNSLDEINHLPQSQMSPVRFSGHQSALPHQNQSTSITDTAYMLNQSLPEGSSFESNLLPHPNQSYPPQNLPNRTVKNPGLSPVRSVPATAQLIHSPGLTQTPAIPPRGIAPPSKPSYMPLSNDTMPTGQHFQNSRSQMPFAPLSPGQGTRSHIPPGPVSPSNGSWSHVSPSPVSPGQVSRGQISPRQQQTSSRAPMATIREQNANDGHGRPNTLPMNNPAPLPTKTTLLRQPLSSPEANKLPQEYFPPPPAQFRGSTIDNQQGQPIIANNFGQMNYQHSQSMDVISRNMYNEQNKPLSHCYDMNNFPSTNKSLAQSYEMQEFPSKFSSSQSLNQMSPNHTRGGLQIPSANQIKESLMNRNASANQMYVGQGINNRNTDSSIRNPPAPPARTDSWENMDKHLNGMPTEPRAQSAQVSDQSVNNSLQHFYGHNQNGPNELNSPIKLAGQNGYLPVKEETGEIYHSPIMEYPLDNSVPQFSHHHTNGNVQNLPISPTNVGPLRRIGIGSEKRSFAKTNVIQASKC